VGRERQQDRDLALGQTLDDHGVLASIGSVGDAYDKRAGRERRRHLGRPRRPRTGA
jgi:hypothetical protein